MKKYTYRWSKLFKNKSDAKRASKKAMWNYDAVTVKKVSGGYKVHKLKVS